MGRKASGKDGKPASHETVRKPVRPDGRVKTTLLLPDDIDCLLGDVARRRHIDRSDLAARILGPGLRRFGRDGGSPSADDAA